MQSKLETDSASGLTMYERNIAITSGMITGRSQMIRKAISVRLPMKAKNPSHGECLSLRLSCSAKLVPLPADAGSPLPYMVGSSRATFVESRLLKRGCCVWGGVLERTGQ